MQYVGGESVAISIPHGDDKLWESRPYEHKAPSVLLPLAHQLQDHATSTVHKEAVATATNMADVPRDYKQVHNVRDRVNSSKRLSQDGLANLHIITYDTLDFVHHHIQTVPGLVVVTGCNDLLNELASLLIKTTTARHICSCCRTTHHFVSTTFTCQFFSFVEFASKRTQSYRHCSCCLTTNVAICTRSSPKFF